MNFWPLYLQQIPLSLKLLTILCTQSRNFGSQLVSCFYMSYPGYLFVKCQNFVQNKTYFLQLFNFDKRHINFGFNFSSPYFIQRNNIILQVELLVTPINDLFKHIFLELMHLQSNSPQIVLILPYCMIKSDQFQSLDAFQWTQQKKYSLFPMTIFYYQIVRSFQFFHPFFRAYQFTIHRRNYQYPKAAISFLILQFLSMFQLVKNNLDETGAELIFHKLNLILLLQLPFQFLSIPFNIFKPFSNKFKVNLDKGQTGRETLFYDLNYFIIRILQG
ncbi:unnamed protein product [Paramecium octaurelia]|uniref:Uncharacterized protein n=1 Tax=Paramecium octaurelia TaxID=43137 RepID=A0A8S1YP17_PAROT|nr:unnamed protein product [Paramecium octaurelia]